MKVRQILSGIGPPSSQINKNYVTRDDVNYRAWAITQSEDWDLHLKRGVVRPKGLPNQI